MPRVCYFTGKKTSAGRSYTHRGKAKYLGGVGTKVTGITKRKFKPNIQRVRALVDGKVVRIKVSTKAIRMQAEKDFKYVEIEGGEHNEASWAQRFGDMLEFAYGKE